MLTEKQLKTRAAILYLMGLFFCAAWILGFYLVMTKIVENSFGNNWTMEQVLDVALVPLIGLTISYILNVIIGIIAFVTLIKLWKYYGPRFWRCFFVILGALGYLYFIVAIILFFGFRISLW